MDRRRFLGISGIAGAGIAAGVGIPAFAGADTDDTYPHGGVGGV